VREVRGGSILADPGHQLGEKDDAPSEQAVKEIGLVCIRCVCVFVCVCVIKVIWSRDHLMNSSKLALANSWKESSLGSHHDQ
jgi:hypothetical protein